MAKSAPTKRGVSREQWILEGLEVLNESGVDQVKVYTLARRLRISRSGFYWHFKDRAELLDALLEYWERITTKVITENVEIRSLDPLSRLVRVAEMVHDYGLARHEIAMNHWALQSKWVAKRVQAVARSRLDFIREAFAELGFEGESLEIRAMLYTLNTTWEDIMYSHVPRKRCRGMIRERVEMMARGD